MNLTRLTKYLAVFIACMQLASCSMDQKIYTHILDDGTFPQTEADVESLVSGSAYNIFSPRKMFGAAAGYQMLSDMLTDVGECSWGNWEPLKYNSYEAGNVLLGGDRNLFAYYNQISAMTLTIEDIKKVDMSEKLKDRYIAELKCGRAFLAFLLYDLYGPLPLPDLETLQNPLADKIVPRLSEEEMQEYIITNLEEAIEVLPYKYPPEDYGRFTKGLARTVLLKLYMYMGDWNKAAEVGAELVENKDLYGYGLVNDYNSLFNQATEQNKEVIYASRAKLGIESAENKWLAHVLTSDYPTTDNLAKWGGYKITWHFYEQYTKGFLNGIYFANDARLERIVAEYVGKDEDGKEIIHNKENDAASGLLKLGVIPIKYEIAGTIGEDSSIDVPVYRFADVMMLYGEALVRRDNIVSSTSMEMLNAVRRRAGVREYGNLSVEKYLENMLKERGLELYFEGCRRQDLIRYGKFIEVAVTKAENAGYSTAKIEQMEDGVYKYHRLPLPPYIIDEGKGKIIQNPGY